MVAFDPNDTLLFNIGVNTFSCIITAIIYFCYKKDFADTYDNGLLRKTAVALFFVLLSDTLMWLLNGRRGAVMRVLGYMDNMAYFILQSVVAFYWLRYVWYRIYGHSLPRKREILGILVPFTALGLVVLSAPLTGWCFYLDEANYYHRGIIAVPLAAILLAYLLLGSVLALAQYRKETLLDRKRELWLIVFFAVPPILGGVAQIIFYGFSLVWPCTAIGYLLVLHDKERREILQDALTGLNNRRNLERYLGVHKENGQKRPVTVIMLDINDFKHINDQYGHQLGDTVLVHAANTLKEIFNGTPAFLARYGGDEFIVIMPESNKSKAESISQSIKNGFEACSRINRFPFRLSVSIGCAISEESSDGGIEELFKRADETMYEDKALYHQQRRTRAI